MVEPKAVKSPAWLKRLGNRIRQVRRIRGLTQTDLAHPSLTKSFISLLESGRTYPSVGTLVTLANRLQTSLALLLLDDTQMARETALNLVSQAKGLAAASPAIVDDLLSAATALAASADDLRAEIMLARGDIAVVQGKPADAGRAYAEALAWAKKRHLRAYEPRVLGRLAALALQRNDYPEARERLEAALEEFRSTRTLRSVDGCNAMVAYADVLTHQGRTSRALRVLLEVARAGERQDLPLIRGRAYLGIGRLQLAAGHRDQAADALRSARTALEAASDGPDLVRTLQALAELLQDLGGVHEAHTTLQHALNTVERTGDTLQRASVLSDLAGVMARLGKHEEAQATARQALESLRAHPDPQQRGRILLTLAQVARTQRRWKQAADSYREAVGIFKKAKLQPALAEAARELGMLLKERGDHAEAAEYLAMAISAERSTAGSRKP